MALGAGYLRRFPGSLRTGRLQFRDTHTRRKLTPQKLERKRLSLSILVPIQFEKARHLLVVPLCSGNGGPEASPIDVAAAACRRKAKRLSRSVRRQPPLLGDERADIVRTYAHGGEL